jgi:hypothetical protein
LGITLLCVSCVSPGPVEIGPLGWDKWFEATGTPVTSFQAGIVLTNISSDPVTLRFANPCVASVRVYEAPTQSTSRSWDQRVWDPGCHAGFAAVYLDPGAEYLALSGPISVAAILGDSLPSGQYEIIATVYSADFPSGQIGITAAQVELRRQ